MYALTPFERKSFDLFNAFHDFENDFFGNTAVTRFKTDLKDEGDKYIMEAELPGFEKGDITLDITGDTLCLSAQHKQEKVEKDKQKYIYLAALCIYTCFYRWYSYVCGSFSFERSPSSSAAAYDKECRLI